METIETFLVTLLLDDVLSRMSEYITVPLDFSDTYGTIFLVCQAGESNGR